MLVRDLMVEDVITVDEDATVKEAVGTMLREHVGSVIVMEENVPIGIFTGTDALVVGYDCDCPFSTIPVTRGMSEDLITGTPDMTVRAAAREMSEAGVKKLPIVKDFKVVGIITFTDIVREHAALLQEASGVHRRQRRWSEDDDD